MSEAHFSRLLRVGCLHGLSKSGAGPWEAYALQCVHPTTVAPSEALKYTGECRNASRRAGANLCTTWHCPGSGRAAERRRVGHLSQSQVDLCSRHLCVGYTVPKSPPGVPAVAPPPGAEGILVWLSELCAGLVPGNGEAATVCRLSGDADASRAGALCLKPWSSTVSSRLLETVGFAWPSGCTREGPPATPVRAALSNPWDASMVTVLMSSRSSWPSCSWSAISSPTPYHGSSSEGNECSEK